MVFFPKVSPAKPCTHLSCLTYVPHASPISFFLIYIHIYIHISLSFITINYYFTTKPHLLTYQHTDRVKKKGKINNTRSEVKTLVMIKISSLLGHYTMRLVISYCSLKGVCCIYYQNQAASNNLTLKTETLQSSKLSVTMCKPAWHNTTQGLETSNRKNTANP